MRELLRRACIAAVVVAATGCLPSLEGNEARAPRVALPASYGPAVPGAGSTSLAQQKWAEIFASPDLRLLIETALANNQELNIQLQEIIIAKSEVTARQGEYLPKLGVGVGVGVEKVSATSSQGVSDDAHGVPANLGNFGFGLTGSWEIDVWGKLRNSAKAADLRYLATIEATRFMTTQLVAEIARSYYELIALDTQIEILKRNIAVQQDALEVVKLEKQAARVTELAVQRFEAEVLKNQSRVFDLEQRRIQAENRLNFLVGRYPQPVARNPAELQIPLPSTLPIGMPSQLLENRPDVRQAELELEASKLDVKAAKQAFYPSLVIDASLGYRSFDVTHLLATPGSLVYGIAAGITAPLLNRAAITAQYRGANARQIQAVIAYEQTVLQAFTDVVNQVAMIDNLKKSWDLQQQQVDTLAKAVDVSTLLFQSADADYMEVLLTRRDTLDAQMELVDTKLRQYLAMVGLYQALGGGWRAK
jgi:NodT family efflux transporter outer membrane factor (OMF) lipoprotein